jgi:hypothetical protein
MKIEVYILPHERSEAIEAYRDRLTPGEIETIENAPDDEIIVVNFCHGKRTEIVFEGNNL